MTLDDAILVEFIEATQTLMGRQDSPITLSGIPFGRLSVSFEATPTAAVASVQVTKNNPDGFTVVKEFDFGCIGEIPREKGEAFVKNLIRETSLMVVSYAIGRVIEKGMELDRDMVEIALSHISWTMRSILDSSLFLFVKEKPKTITINA